jgi:hypothetical protein
VSLIHCRECFKDLGVHTRIIVAGKTARRLHG